MRTLLGGLVLVAGVGGVGWYGASHNAKTMQSEVTQGANAAAQNTIHDVSTSVSGRDITVSGIANDDAERDLILEAMGDVKGRRVVRDDLRVLETASPFALNAVKNAEGMSFVGMVPTEAVRAQLIDRIGPAAQDFDLMAGAPSGDWASVVGTGLDGLAPLEEGTLAVIDTDVTITGIARTPTEESAARAAVGALPDGFDAAFDITLLDDGTPPAFDLAYDAGTGATLTGKLPSDTGADDIAAALGLGGISGDAYQGLIGEGIDVTTPLAALSDWLPEIDSMTYASNDGVVSIDAVVGRGVDGALITEALAEGPLAGATIAFSNTDATYDDGAERMNQATGQTEVFTGQYWLPVVDFVASKDSCNTFAADALSSNKVNFLSGSATLDAKSIRAINAVAAVIRTCLAEADLTVEVGGHTDNQGGTDLNQQLSQDRAETVRLALVDRGASEADITARGYGSSDPIADNETEDGRAANRRTTITWFDAVTTPTPAETTATPVGE